MLAPHRGPKALTFTMFKQAFSEAHLELSEKSLFRSFRALQTLQQRKNLSSHHVINKLHAVALSVHPEVRKGLVTLDVATIPLTELEWDQSN